MRVRVLQFLLMIGTLLSANAASAAGLDLSKLVTKAEVEAALGSPVDLSIHGSDHI